MVVGSEGAGGMVMEAKSVVMAARFVVDLEGGSVKVTFPGRLWGDMPSEDAAVPASGTVEELSPVCFGVSSDESGGVGAGVGAVLEGQISGAPHSLGRFRLAEIKRPTEGVLSGPLLSRW